MPVWIYLAGAVAAGAIVSVQPVVNAILARAVGSAWGATAISIAVAFGSALVMLALAGRGSDFSRSALTSVPWWVYLAGVAGLIFVAAGIVIAPVTGALLFFACVVGGQLLGATLADHFGAFGLDIRPISLGRAAGIGLVLVGALLVHRG